MSNTNEEKYKILIVDDIPSNIQLLGNVLYGNNIEVSFATNGEKALKMLRYNLPDLILLDIAMPEMDGFEVCKRLKENPQTTNIPVIFLTARIDSQDILKGFELGAVDYIKKPFNMAELLSRVNIHIELKRSRDTINRQNKELDKKNKQLAEQNRELQALNLTKDKFFSIIAHDLKNPFNTLIGYSELLINNLNILDEDKVKLFLQRIFHTSKNGYYLLENLLAWSRTKTGHIGFEPQLLNLADIGIETIEIHNTMAQNKNISLSNKLPSVLVFADLNMLSSILRNLVSNAIKFTEKGGEIILSAKQKYGLVEICVEDNGIGISEEAKERIFKDIEHFTTEGTMNEKGTGLGLLLCKEFVTKNSGKIWIESETKKGSKFKFTLHQKPPEEKENSEIY